MFYFHVGLEGKNRKGAYSPYRQVNSGGIARVSMLDHA